MISFVSKMHIDNEVKKITVTTIRRLNGFFFFSFGSEVSLLALVSSINLDNK